VSLHDGEDFGGYGEWFFITELHLAHSNIADSLHIWGGTATRIFAQSRNVFRISLDDPDILLPLREVLRRKYLKRHIVACRN
jgi:hypothetical protein